MLAKEVYAQLKKSGTLSVPGATIQKLNRFKEKRTELIAATKKADEDLQHHDATLRQITGKAKNAQAYKSVSDIVELIKEANVPSLSDIEDRITLRGLFNNEDDMETFVSAIVKEFSKKKRETVESN